MTAIIRFLKTALILAVMAVGGALAFALSGWYDVSVGSGHNAATQWFLQTLRERSIARRAGALEVPDLSGEGMVKAGAMVYNRGCVGCHGRPGNEPRASFDPRPPALTRMRLEPAAIFWVVRHGIKMSAMPAIDATRVSDEEVWQVAAFLQVASSLTEGEYRELVKPPPAEPAIEEESPASAPESAPVTDNSGKQQN